MAPGKRNLRKPAALAQARVSSEGSRDLACHNLAVEPPGVAGVAVLLEGCAGFLVEVDGIDCAVGDGLK